MAQLDSQKIEKLLSSATSERQRKMYQALLKKARSQEAAAKASSTTETKVKAQAVLGKVQKQEQKTSGTDKKKTTQQILEKAPSIESVLLESPQSEVDNETKTLPKLEAPPKLEKPPAREKKSTKSSSKADLKVVNEALTNTSKSATENNKKSAEEKSSKNQKQVEDKKAKSSKQKGTKKKTHQTKVQEEVPVFQALGKMILTPYLKENDLKVEFNGQEYDLLYGSDYTFVAHKKLREELSKKGSRKMLLKLYPKVQFSNNSEKPKLSFILGGFEKKYYTKRKYPEKFKLRGIWQYIPQTETPVISIYRISYPQEITEWQVVPVINNEAQIVSLILEKTLSPTELITTPSNLIIEAGTIIEVGKIDDRFKIKVYQHKGKTVKITAHSGEVEMKLGQLWSMKLVLKEDHLYVEEVKYLKD